MLPLNCVTYLILKQSREENGCRVHNLILYNRNRKYAISTDDFAWQFGSCSNIAPQSGTMPSLENRLNSWSQYKSVLFTLFTLSLGACHILIYCSSLNLPPLNPDVINFQGHSFKMSLTNPLPSIIHLFPLHVIRLSCLDSERPHGFHVLSHAPKNIAPLLIMP